MSKKKYYLYKIKLTELNILSLLLLVLFVLITIWLYGPIDVNDNSFFICFAFMVPYLILHEVIHAIFYSLNGAKYKNITFGVHLEKGVLCCLCKQRISKKGILMSLLAPFMLIGVITYIIGLLINDLPLIILSIINISGCAGDLMMFFGLSKIKKFEYSEFDDPTSFGIYTSEDLSKTKLLGLEYVGVEDKLEIKDYKKFDISFWNAVALILIALVGIVNLFI